MITNLNAREIFYDAVLHKDFIEYPQGDQVFLSTTFYRFLNHFHWELAQQYTPLLPIEKPLQCPMETKAFLYFLGSGFRSGGNEQYREGDFDFQEIPDRDPHAFTCLKVMEGLMKRFTADWIEKIELSAKYAAVKKGLPGRDQDYAELFRNFFLDSVSGKLIMRFLDGGFAGAFENLDVRTYLEMGRSEGLWKENAAEIPEEIKTLGMDPGEFYMPRVPWSLVRAFIKAGIHGIFLLFGKSLALELKKDSF